MVTIKFKIRNKDLIPLGYNIKIAHLQFTDINIVIVTILLLFK